MDKRKARKELQTLRDSITEVLGETSSTIDSSDIKESIKQAEESAREGAKALKKSLIERIKDLPVVTQVTQLGTAGTVAVSTAAVTQVDIAKARTEIFVAEVANDVVEERFEIPQFFDNMIDFQSLNVWGQQVIAEQIAEATDFVESVETKVEVSEPQSTSGSSSSEEGNTPESSSSSQDSASDSPSDAESEQTEAESEKGESEAEQSKSSTEEKSDTDQKEAEQDKSSTESEKSTTEDTQEQSPKQTGADVQETQSSTKTSPNSTSEIPFVKTPISDSIAAIDDIKPHSTVSPTQ